MGWIVSKESYGAKVYLRNLAGGPTVNKDYAIIFGSEKTRDYYMKEFNYTEIEIVAGKGGHYGDPKKYAVKGANKETTYKPRKRTRRKVKEQ